jgi:hypothetical protein
METNKKNRLMKWAEWGNLPNRQIQRISNSDKLPHGIIHRNIIKPFSTIPIPSS